MTMAIAATAGVTMALAARYAAHRLWSFQAQRPSDYADQEPVFDAREALSGSYLSEGMIHDYTGRVRARFKAEMDGDLDDSGGVLRERFVYQDGGEQHREWTLRFGSDGTLTATAPDIVGEAHGEQSGNTLRLRYRLRLPDSAGGHVLDVTDWMYLTADGTILNRSEMRKFGIKAAELFAVMKHREPMENAA